MSDSSGAMPESPAFTVAIDADGRDLFDFEVRGALASKTKRDMGIPSDRPLPAPWLLAIEPMMACNARCNFCAFSEQRTHMKLQAKDQLRSGLPDAVVREILEFARENGTKGTYWSGGGEPTLWAHFDKAVSQCAEFSDVFVQTNGTQLDRFTATVEDLARFRLISVSVVGDSVSLNDKIGMGAFKRISQNIAHIVALKNIGNLKLEINAKLIVTRENHLRLPEIVSYYESMGVDTVSLRMAQDFASTNPEDVPSESVVLSEVEKAGALESIDRSTYEHPSLTAFRGVLTASERFTFPRTRKCYSASDGHIAYVTADGSVYIGTAEMASQTLSIGNALTTPWPEIWGGDRHLEVIEEMNRLQRAGQCPMHLCRHLKANQGAEAYLDGRLGPLDAEAIMNGLGAFL